MRIREIRDFCMDAPVSMGGLTGRAMRRLVGRECAAIPPYLHRPAMVAAGSTPACVTQGSSNADVAARAGVGEIARSVNWSNLH